MHALTRSIVVALATFGASALGMALQTLLPAQTLAESRGTVGAMIGLITLLLALVLGLLIWTAFGVYSGQQSEAQSLGPVAVELDLMLEKYGPEGALGRKEFRLALGRAHARFYGDKSQTPRPWTFDEMRATMRGMSWYFEHLKPETDLQKDLIVSARQFANNFAQTQMLMARQLANPVPSFLLAVVVCWSLALFFANGLIAAVDPITIGAHFFGAVAISSAIFLILELSQPYSGFIRLPSRGLEAMMKAMDAAMASAG